MRDRLILGLGMAAMLGLGACAAPHPAPPTSGAPMTAAPTTARVAAVRDVRISPGNGASSGVDAVLAGLRQPALRQPVTGSEVVVVKRDGNAASMVVPASTLTPGMPVAVISAATTSFVPQN